MFVFNVANELEFEIEDTTSAENRHLQENKLKKKLIDNELLQSLIEKMIFHQKQNISFNYCFLSTLLLNFQAKNVNKQKNVVDTINMAFFKSLFELTKNGLFSIIIECDRAIEENYKENTKIDDNKDKSNERSLLDNTKYLKV